MRFTGILIACALAGCSPPLSEQADQDEDGFSVDEGDCDDFDATVFPGAADEWYDGIDQDCVGNDDFDQDSDGHASSLRLDYEGDLPHDDCEDTDPTRHGAAPDLVGDGVDNNCDTVDGVDQDGDGVASVGSGGTDCLDDGGGALGVNPASVYPGATETWYDGVDSNCDGVDDFDRDGDGHAWDQGVARFTSDGGTYAGGLPVDDCIDDPAGSFGVSGADIHGGAPETWYDGVDQNCGDDNDFDQDSDGFASTLWVETFEASGGVYMEALPPTDCADSPVPTTTQPLPGSLMSPGVAEVWYDGIDQDCGADDDFDADGDGHADPTGVMAFEASGSRYFGLPVDDCSDAEASVNPSALETWYDGVDQDCAGDDDFDQDSDGFTDASEVLGFVQAGGTYEGTLPTDDCDDGTTVDGAETYPGAPDTVGDSVDQNCDAVDGVDADADGYASVESGGNDCADSAAPDTAVAPSAINPGVSEIWYDGLDQNCDGSNDFDQDQDGFASTSEVEAFIEDGGVYVGSIPIEDCDDSTESVNPNVREVCEDGIDNNCDGTALGCRPDGLVTGDDANLVFRGGTGETYFGFRFTPVGDITGDAHPDLLVHRALDHDGDEEIGGSSILIYAGPFAGSDTVFLEDHSVATLGPAEFSPGSNRWSFGALHTVMDWNADGVLDLVAADNYENEIYVWYGPLVGQMSSDDSDVVISLPDFTYDIVSLVNYSTRVDGVPNRLVVGVDDSPFRADEWVYNFTPALTAVQTEQDATAKIRIPTTQISGGCAGNLSVETNIGFETLISCGNDTLWSIPVSYVGTASLQDIGTPFSGPDIDDSIGFARRTRLVRNPDDDALYGWTQSFSDSNLSSSVLFRLEESNLVEVRSTPNDDSFRRNMLGAQTGDIDSDGTLDFVTHGNAFIDGTWRSSLLLSMNAVESSIPDAIIEASGSGDVAIHDLNMDGYDDLLLGVAGVGGDSVGELRVYWGGID